MTSGSKSRDRLKMLAMLAVVAFAGCTSSQDKANDAAVEQAKQQVAATGNAQQVVSTDADGNTVTTVVRPPAPGQTTQQITVTKTKTTTTTGGRTSSRPVVGTAAPGQPAVVGGTPGSTGYGAATQPGETAAPVAGGGPVITPLDIEVPAGTTLAIRVNQRISVKTWHAGEPFSGEVVRPVMVGNSTAIPEGTRVHGVVSQAHRRGHFKGRSYLGLRLTSMELNGQSYDLDTRSNVRTKKGKGKRSAAFIGGGTGAGMLIGGLATGGVGLVVGGLIGAGGGTLLGGLTGNRDLVIPAESVVSFRLADDLAVVPQ